MKSAALANMIVSRANPAYPESAQSKGIGGEVMMSIRIGKDGKIGEVSVVSGPPELRKAAVDAMKKW